MAVPRPHGWVGTADDWARGLGIAFAVLDLAVLVLAWRSVRRTGGSPLSKELLFGGIAVLPLAVVFFAYSYGLEASKTVDACGSCHVMTPWVNDLRNPKSDTLAAAHFKNVHPGEPLLHVPLGLREVGTVPRSGTAWARLPEFHGPIPDADSHRAPLLT